MRRTQHPVFHEADDRQKADPGRSFHPSVSGGGSMTEIIFTKRAGRQGEVGLFVDTPVFDAEWTSLKLGVEVKAECTVPANLRYLKFFWALVGKVTENSPDGFLDKQDCADRILLEARHFKMVYDHRREKSEMRVKSISGLSGDTWIRLLRRVTDVVVMKYLPGMDQNVLKAEIEAMVGVTTDPEPPKRAPRAKQSPAVGQEEAGKEVQQPDLPSSASNGDVQPAGSSPNENRPGSPTNEAEYIAAARSWIRKQTASHEDARSYFDGDHHVAMRRACKVSIGTRNMLRRELSEHYEQKGRENAKEASG
jgi:hypothetical protein